ncbi:hypothetical protein BD289DRAFT_442006 [Coniella lustricola]|uniref:ribonuclease Z n=1 Tax=Coniella lustricola TaxID=2025994 RepID=A0A2T2ZYP8_9PEZI|nr:hypothetical protein BD289DRAFT_442006 [Coniella lustricola]
MSAAVLRAIRLNAATIQRLPQRFPRARTATRPAGLSQLSSSLWASLSRSFSSSFPSCSTAENSSALSPSDPLAQTLASRTQPPPVTFHKLARHRWRDEPHALLLYRRNNETPPTAIETPIDIPGRSHDKPMLQYLQIVSVPAADSPGPCVLLHFDNRRYIFGHVAEGTQRAMAQRRVGLAKLDEIFISGPVSWKSTGGLLGTVLTIADVVATQKLPDESAKKKKKKADGHLSTIPSLKIYGAENIMHMVATARRFVFRKGMPLRLHEIVHDPAVQRQQGRKPDFEDANVRVWYISVKPETGGASSSSSSASTSTSTSTSNRIFTRKRSHEEMTADNDFHDDAAGPAQDPAQRQADRETVKSIVDNMFDSDWELDALVESKLSQVRQPAQVFVKDAEGKITKYEGPMPQDSEPWDDITVLTRMPWPATKVTRLPHTSPSNQSLSYIVKAQPRRGKFDVDEAVRLGVEKWDFKHLTRGQTVKGKDGIDVTPEMVVGATIDGRGFAFIDLPNETYIDDFLACPEWHDTALLETLDIFYWNLGPGVAEDPRIKDYLCKHPKIIHTVFTPDLSPNIITLHAAANSLIKMHRIDPDRFQLPVFNTKGGRIGETDFKVARLGAKLLQSPRVEVINDELVKSMNMVDPVRTMDRRLQSMADQARKQSQDPKFLADIEESESDIPNRDTEVIALGTGSALPSKYRNVSATLVRVPGHGSYLFDCGENTLGQLRRMYGYEKTDEILSDLKVIWISHLHADHHLGTASIIRAWNQVTTPRFPIKSPPRLTVVSHANMIDWIREYADVEDFGIDRLRLINVRGPAQRESVQYPITFEPNTSAARDTGLVRIDSCRVDHCHGSLACVFVWPSGLRIAYSGDCRPSKSFIRIGQDCTLLIHEATLDDELEKDAYFKKHCTMSQAMDVALQMKARRVLLTHFSQRYPKIGNAFERDDARDAIDQVVLLAFDMMRVKLGDFKKAELFLPTLRKMLEAAPEDPEDAVGEDA